MAKTAPFDAHPTHYDDWFRRNETAYLSELLAVRAMLPWQGLGLEIGVGTGRFAAPLGVPFGLDPSQPMLAKARQRGIRVVQGVAENLPFRDGSFARVLVVVTLCFVDDVRAMFDEVRRVLRPSGVFVIGFLDWGGTAGRDYLSRHAEQLFYRQARFYSGAKVDALLREYGFHHSVWVQTLFHPPADLSDIEPLRPGRGDGLFVVVRAHNA
jgi:SAM-dependent methyltransferase